MVAHESIKRRTSVQCPIKALKLKRLSSILTRPIEVKDGRLWCPISQAPMATEFAISRFAVPFLQKSGWALFVDCDIVCWEDITNLFALADPKYAVMCVKHQNEVWEKPIIEIAGSDVDTKGAFLQMVPDTKMDNQIQTFYARKNWSSVVLWNCDHEANQRFTLKMLNTLPGRDLHAFCWLKDDEIGELPQKWNWLVNVTPGTPEKHGIWHMTLGGPWLRGWKESPFDSDWIEEAKPR